MKKFIMILFIGLLIIINGEILKAQEPPVQCLPGEVQLTKYVTINVNGTNCQYKIILCVECPAGTGQAQFKIRLKSYVPYPINCGFTDDTQVRDKIWAMIYSPNWITLNIATDCFAGWGPCPENAQHLTCITPKCWTKVGYWDDEQIWRVIRVACDSDPNCVCKYEKVICWNPQTQDFDIQTTADEDNYLQCCPENTIPDDPEEGNTTPTGCYYLACPVVE